MDVIYNFVGDQPEPILESIKRWRYSCGEHRLGRRPTATAGSSQPPASARCRSSTPGWTAGPTASTRAPGTGRATAPATASTSPASLGNEIVAEVAPQAQDVYFVKDKPSAFLRHPPAGYLIYFGRRHPDPDRHDDQRLHPRDAVDAFSYNYYTIVPEECVWDRGQLSTRSTSSTSRCKYGDVKPVDAVIAYLARCHSGPAASARRPL